MGEGGHEARRDRVEVMSKWVHTNLFDHLEKSDRDYWRALESFKKYVRNLGSQERMLLAYDQIKLQLQVEDLKSAEPGHALRKKRLTESRTWFNKTLKVLD